MAGFHHDHLRTSLRVPDAYHLGVVMAIGYPGNPEHLPTNLRAREQAPRERYLQTEFVMNKTF
jgi:hypothetical protein